MDDDLGPHCSLLLEVEAYSDEDDEDTKERLFTELVPMKPEPVSQWETEIKVEDDICDLKGFQLMKDDPLELEHTPKFLLEPSSAAPGICLDRLKHLLSTQLKSCLSREPCPVAEPVAPVLSQPAPTEQVLSPPVPSKEVPEVPIPSSSAQSKVSVTPTSLPPAQSKEVPLEPTPPEDEHHQGTDGDTSAVVTKPAVEGKGVKCDHCGVFFLKDKDLALHSLSESYKTSFTRLSGRKQFRTKPERALHCCPSILRVLCTICGKIIAKDQLRIHKRMHTGQQPYQCSFCRKTYRSIFKLKKHEKIHVNETVFQCAICEQRFASCVMLETHIESHNKDEKNSCGERLFACVSCPKKFFTGSKLNLHNRIHKADHHVVCSVCGKSITRFYLESHMIMHSGKRPFRCTVCGKAFTSYPTLDGHLKMHRGDKRFQCTICNKRFISNSSLRVHYRRHTLQKPFVCSICSKGFVNGHSLEIHMLSHKGERPYQCKTCGKCFRYSRPLQTHVRSFHTGERPFSCDTCGRSFTEKRGLRSHVKVHLQT